MGEGSVQVIERFVNDPPSTARSRRALLNQLVRAREDRMPVRRYFVKAGKKTQVAVKESPPGRYQLRIEGGDRDGQTSRALPAASDVFLLGRGPWHGDDQQVANDVIVLARARSAVSRRAARLHRVGGGFELESLDQREALVVAQPDGQRLRPALSASGRVPVRPGDAIEFTDGSEDRAHRRSSRRPEPCPASSATSTIPQTFHVDWAGRARRPEPLEAHARRSSSIPSWWRRRSRR